MRKPDVRAVVDAFCSKKGSISASDLATRLGISRQAAHRKLAAAVDAGWLARAGAGRAARYVASNPSIRYPIHGAREEQIFSDLLRRIPGLSDLVPEERAIVAYTFTEMANNAIEHSQGKYVSVRMKVTDSAISVEVTDDGIGAFESIRAGLGLTTLVQAAAEVTKGKVTTMPSRHSGEGIFFSSKATDRFELTANSLQLLIVARDVNDIAIMEVEQPARVGTLVAYTVQRPVKKTLATLFAEYTEEFEFVRTRTVVRLFGLGTDFVSRSEAKRLLAGLEKFKEVILDFVGVPGIGQGFADEIFRVFAADHPTVRLVPIHMNEPVSFFVNRALAAAK